MKPRPILELFSIEKEEIESVELRISFESVVILAILVCIAGLLINGSAIEGPEIIWKYLLIIYFPVPLISWALYEKRPLFSPFILSVALVGVILLGSYWFDSRSYLYALVIPVILAVVSSSLALGSLIVTIETAALFILGATSQVGTAASVFILPGAASWATLGLLTAVYLPIYECMHKYRQQYIEHRREVEKMRSHRMEQAMLIEDLDNANRQMALLFNKNQLLRQLAEHAEQTKAAFLARVSHEFRTPLSIIIGLTDLLMDTPDLYGTDIPPELLEDMKIVNRNCDHLLHLVDDILDLSRTEAGQLTLHQEWIEITGIVNEAIELVKPLLKKKELYCHLNDSISMPKIYCDPNRIRQVILNLIGNALRYTEKGGISIMIQSEENHIVISVTDTGPGISGQDLTRIFDPFYQGIIRPKHGIAGSGLGLSICRQFIEMHGGKIWVESKLGSGSTFSFLLPVDNSSESAQAIPASPRRWIVNGWGMRDRKPRLTVNGLSEKKRILVYDETNKLVPILAHYNDELDFLRLDHLEEIDRTPSEMVILNIAEPESLMASMQKAKQSSSFTPVVGVSFSSFISDPAKAGVVGYLVKPFKYDMFLTAFKQVKTQVKKVLIADDDPDIRQLLTRMLLTAGDYEIIYAESGERALEALKANPPDVVLLDIVLGDMDGWQVLEQKNNYPDQCGIPVIIISGQDLMDYNMRTAIIAATFSEGLTVRQCLESALDFSALLFNESLQRSPTPG